MQGPLACHYSIRLILSRSRSVSCRMHRMSPRTRTRRSSRVNTVVYACNIKANHLPQRPAAEFSPVTRFHSAAGAGHSRSVGHFDEYLDVVEACHGGHSAIFGNYISEFPI
jgi:hypothetical protein